MAKKSNDFICQNCDYSVSKWIGKCPECGEWNSFVEGVSTLGRRVEVSNEQNLKSSSAITLDEIEMCEIPRKKTLIGEFDRVLGGGIVYGSLILIGGEPGIGKSTLLLEVFGKLCNNFPNEKFLYVSGEESSPQIATRAKRLGINFENLYILHQSSLKLIEQQIEKLKPSFLVLDSIQTTYSDEVGTSAGTVSQIREVTYKLMELSKQNGISTFVIGHITKEGSIAGPKILEHMVDTVIYFEGDQLGNYRLLRTIKNRFGNTNEVGLFEMREEGLFEVTNPSQFFLIDHMEGNPGRSLSCIMEGTRSLFVEIQALAVENKYGTGRRTTQGLDTNRVATIIAIIEKYLSLPIGYNDIYVNVAGGLKINSRDVDLSILASLVSSYKNIAIDSKTVFIGELGLGGEVRPVPNLQSRIKEMAQLNYKRVITSEKNANELRGKHNIEIIGIKKAAEVLKYIE